MKELTPLEKSNRSLCTMYGHKIIEKFAPNGAYWQECERCGITLAVGKHNEVTDILGNETDKQGE